MGYWSQPFPKFNQSLTSSNHVSPLLCMFASDSLNLTVLAYTVDCDRHSSSVLLPVVITAPLHSLQSPFRVQG